MSFPHLPVEILQLIMTYLSIPDLLSASLVSSYWRNTSARPQLWQDGTLEVTSLVQSCASVRFKQRYVYLKDVKERIRHVGGILSSHIDDAHFAGISSFFPNLRRMELIDCKISPETFMQVLWKLRHTVDTLVLQSSPISDQVVEFIGTHLKLKTLKLSKCNVSPNTLVACLEKSRHLEHLGLSAVYTLDDSSLYTLVPAIASLPDLKTLDLSKNSSAITYHTLRTLVSDLTGGPVQITVKDCEQLTQKDVQTIESLGKVTLVSNAALFDYSLQSVRDYLDFVLAH